jgi:uncharacterized repeat protein (TIGR01451 family)
MHKSTEKSLKSHATAQRRKGFTPQQLFVAHLAACGLLALVMLHMVIFPSSADSPRSAPSQPTGQADAPPISAATWARILEQVQQDAFHLVWQTPPDLPAAYYAANRGHNLLAAFTRQGVRLSPQRVEMGAHASAAQTNWYWHLQPVAYGEDAALLALPTAAHALHAQAQRVEITWDDHLSEWYVNDERGIKHGFTLWERPGSRGDGATSVVIDMRLSTDLTPVLESAAVLRFEDDYPQTVLRYSDLHVFDADGRSLAARLTVKPRNEQGDVWRTALNAWGDAPPLPQSLYTLRISVEDAGATYPLTIDPLITGDVRKLTASDGAAGDQFGTAVAVNGDTIVVGAPGADVGINSAQGAAYLFERNQSGAGAWGQIKKLTAADGAAFDNFGGAVAVSGGFVVVGAAGSNVNGNLDQGSAYLFGRDQGGANGWGQVKQLVASDGATFDNFGGSLAIDQNTIVVGANQDNVGDNSNQGSAYLYERDWGGAENWGQVTQITASDGATEDFFASAVAISGDQVVMGANGDSVAGNSDQGSAYLFVRNHGGANGWGQVTQLIANDGAPGDLLGSAVAVQADLITVGAPGDDVAANVDQGSAMLFGRNQGGSDAWGQIKKLVATGGGKNDEFGGSLALDGDTLIVGARRANVQVNNDQGSAYLFDRNQKGANAWGQLARLVSGDGAANDGFGQSVAMDGNTYVVGASGHSVNSNADQGAAYVYTIAIGRLADLSIGARVTPSAALPGQTITYTLNFSNAGPGGAFDIVVTDAVPAGIAVTAITSSTTAAGVTISQTNGAPSLAWIVNWLDAGDSGKIEITGQVNDDLALVGTTLRNAASIMSVSDISQTNNSVSTDLLVLPPPGTLTVTKIVVNDNGGSKNAADFPLFANGLQITSGVASTLDAGLYTITEAGGTGYTATFSGDCDTGGKVTLTPRSQKICTITNDDQPASLTVIKSVVNDNGGTKTVADFPLFANGTAVTSGSVNILDAGTYTISETNAVGYTATFSGDCDANGKLTLSPGDAKSCTITNDDQIQPSVIYLPIVAGG